MGRIILLAIVCTMVAAGTLCAQTHDDHAHLEGFVMEELVNGKLQPLEFVHVYWLKSKLGIETDSSGYFRLDRQPDDMQLVVNYVGYLPDTIAPGKKQFVNIMLKGGTVLDEVDVVFRKPTTEISYLDPRFVQSISQDELFKAACCNLSESFETNASVDVNFNDAVTGAKEIMMLGLAGRYTMLSQEFMPGIRGISIPYGLLYTPGAWVESMQITKGAGSVVNGFESIAGQINIEMKKPRERERVFINAYANNNNRYELNALGAIDLSSKLSTSILTHGSVITDMVDRNNDGFTDVQEGELFVLGNRWKYESGRSLEGQVNFRYTSDKKTGGQMGFDPAVNNGLYGAVVDAERVDIWGKTGFIFPQRRFQSIGFQWALSDYKLNTKFGVRPYSGHQQTAYGNLIFQSIIGTTDHKFKTGGGILADTYDETFALLPDSLTSLMKDEIVPGIFFEYTYTRGEKFTLVAGVRADHHSIYGSFVTPRLHLRYAPRESTVFRASAGRGYRSPNPIAENLGLLASSRNIYIEGDSDEGPLGLEMESAWNMGISVSQSFQLDFRPGQISADLFHTTFDEQVVVDIDEVAGHAHLYNLDGQSYSTSFQVETSWEALKRLDVKAAWRILDVRTEHHIGLLQRALIPRHRGFLNVAYTTIRKPGGHWTFDATMQHIGTQRLPNTSTFPEGLQLPETAPDYRIVHAQITRRFANNLDVYLGAENLFDFKQQDPILSADDPFGPYFDSGLAWGPIVGRTVYLGVRYLVNRIENE